MSSLFAAHLGEHQALFARLTTLDDEVSAIASHLAATLSRGGKLLLCGNGGSAADCQHIAAELTGRFVADRRPLAALALTTDTSALTAIANDYSFDDVFSRQVLALARPGDCVIGISTSGRSANVLRAVAAAREVGATSVGLLGRDGGELKSTCDHCVIVPSHVTARIQEAHGLIGHAWCALIEQALGLDQSTAAAA
jgi:D-sedoheptulose 7-phosphate isomerase